MPSCMRKYGTGESLQALQSDLSSDLMFLAGGLGRVTVSLKPSLLFWGIKLPSLAPQHCGKMNNNSHKQLAQSITSIFHARLSTPPPTEHIHKLHTHGTQRVLKVSFSPSFSLCVLNKSKAPVYVKPKGEDELGTKLYTPKPKRNNSASDKYHSTFCLYKSDCSKCLI